jgi:two-component system OmpR family response regulator
MPPCRMRQTLVLLLLFVQHPEQVRTRQQIVEHVWGEWFGSHHLIDVHLSRLRCKIARATDRAVLPAVRGVGYRLGVAEST